MRQILTTSILMLAAWSLITGLLYPLAVTGIAVIIAPDAAEGRLIRAGDKIVGAEYVGQPFDDPRYFWGRPSATGPFAYNALSGSGSNRSQTNPAWLEAVREQAARLRAADPENMAPIPVDLVTASASGLDPHVSPAAARYQASRVARVRNLDVAQVQELIDQYTEGPTLGFLGQARVNVLRLNLALDGAL